MDKVFIVVLQDRVVQIREYVVIANNEDHAAELVQQGHFISESASSTVDTEESVIVKVEEVLPEDIMEKKEPPVEKISDLLESILDMDNSFYKAKGLRLFVDDLRKAGK